MLGVPLRLRQAYALAVVAASQWLLLFNSALVHAKGRSCGGSVRHVTISVGHDPSTQMIVTFGSISSKYKAPVGGVLFGTSLDALDTLVLEQETPTYYQVHSAGMGNEGNDHYVSSYYHHVIISGLQPSTRYYYRPVIQASTKAFEKYNLRTSSVSSYGNMQELNVDFKEAVRDETVDEFSHRDLKLEEAYVPVEWDETHRGLLSLRHYDGTMKACPSPEKIRSFQTAPVPGSDTPVTFAICGDIGQFLHSEELMTRMLRNREDMDVMILAGDLAYGNLDNRGWDTFQDFLEDYPLSEHIPMQIVPGNHDIEKQKDGRDIFLAYEHRFRMPQVKPAQLGLYEGDDELLNMDNPPYPLPYEWGNAYYSFTYGIARVIMINAYSSMEPDSTQYQWIKSELLTVDRTVTPWVLAVLHTPMYNTFSLHQHDHQILAARTHLEPLFVEHSVNMVFSGHIHAYFRSNNVMYSQINPKGPVYITVGAGGRKCEAAFLNPEPEPWVHVRDATFYGYGMFKISNSTTAVWDWVHTGHADDRDYNQLYRSNMTLPGGPGRDRAVIINQYFL